MFNESGIKTRRVTLLQAFFILALIACLHNTATHYIAAGRDDAFISLWTGRALAEGRGLVNYNDEPVEMASSLLHTLLIAGLSLLVSDSLFIANKLLGTGAGLLLLIVLYRRRWLLFSDCGAPLIACGMTLLLLANDPAWLYWNAGGLETPYQSLLLFLYGIHCARYWRTGSGALPVAVIQLLYLFVRPEGFLIVLCTCVFGAACLFLKKPLAAKQAAIVIGLPALFFLAAACLRYLAFGTFFPNPVYAKIGTDIIGHAGRVGQGIAYLKDFYASGLHVKLQGIILLCVCGYYFHLFFIARRSAAIAEEFPRLVWVGLIAIHHLFVVLAGGDWMERHRFMAPVVPCITLVTIIFPVRWIASLRHVPLRRAAASAGVMVFVLMVGALAVRHPAQSENCAPEKKTTITSMFLRLDSLHEAVMLRNCTYRRDYEGMGPFIDNELPRLYEQLGRRLMIVTVQMGYVPYHIKTKYPGLNIQFIDTRGLGDAHIARLPLQRDTSGLAAGVQIESIVSGRMQELSAYVLSKQPNMLYMIGASRHTRQTLEQNGWRIAWEKPGAVVFIRQ